MEKKTTKTSFVYPMGDVIQYQENKRVNSITLVGADTADVARDENHNVTLILKSDTTKEDKLIIDANQLKDNQPYINIVRENGQTYLVLHHDNTKADKSDLENIPTNSNLEALRNEIEKRAYKIESGTPELLEVAEQEETTVLRVLPDGNKIETILSSGELVEITKDGTTYTIEVLADPNKLDRVEFESYLSDNDFASQIGDILNLIEQLSTRLDTIEAGAEVNREIATEAEALAGEVNDKDMTPLRVMQVIESMLAPINANLENHLSDNVKHITQAEREKWNSAGEEIPLANNTRNGLMTSTYAKALSSKPAKYTFSIYRGTATVEDFRFYFGTNSSVNVNNIQVVTNTQFNILQSILNPGSLYFGKGSGIEKLSASLGDFIIKDNLYVLYELDMLLGVMLKPYAPKGLALPDGYYKYAVTNSSMNFIDSDGTVVARAVLNSYSPGIIYCSKNDEGDLVVRKQIERNVSHYFVPNNEPLPDPSLYNDIIINEFTIKVYPFE